MGVKIYRKAGNREKCIFNNAVYFYWSFAGTIKLAVF